MKKISSQCFIITTIILFLIGCTNGVDLDQTDEQELIEGGVSYELRTKDGKGINFGSSITPENGEIQNTFSFTHEYNFKGKYGLMLLLDNKQVPFFVNEQMHSFFQFEINENETIDIETKVTDIKNEKEIVFLVIFQPEYHLNDKDISRAMDVHYPHYIKVPIDTNEKLVANNPEFEEPVGQSLKNVNSDSIRLMRKKDDFQLITTAKSEEKIYMSLGNELEEEINYSIIAFQNWKQVTFDDNSFVKNVRVSPGKGNYYDLTLPKVENDSNYQLFAFPYSEEIAYSILPSPRITIQKK